MAEIGRTNERICSIRPCRTCPKAISVMTARVKPTRVVIFAGPRMKWRSKPILLNGKNVLTPVKTRQNRVCTKRPVFNPDDYVSLSDIRWYTLHDSGTDSPLKNGTRLSPSDRPPGYPASSRTVGAKSRSARTRGVDHSVRNSPAERNQVNTDSFFIRHSLTG